MVYTQKKWIQKTVTIIHFFNFFFFLGCSLACCLCHVNDSLCDKSNSSQLKDEICAFIAKVVEHQFVSCFWEMPSAHPTSVSAAALLACFTELLSLMVRSWCCASPSLSLSPCLCSWNWPASKRDTHHCTYISIKYIPHAQGAVLDTVIHSSVEA